MSNTMFGRERGSGEGVCVAAVPWFGYRSRRREPVLRVVFLSVASVRIMQCGMVERRELRRRGLGLGPCRK